MALGRTAIAAFFLAAVASAAETPRFDSGLALYRAGKFDAALREFQASENSGETQPQRPFYEGVCLAKQTEWSGAITYLEPYTASTPTDARGWYWLAQARLYAKQFDGAKMAVDRAIALDGNSAEAFRTLGEIELELKNHDAAYRAWMKSNQLDPHDPRTTYYLGRLFFEAEFYNEAAAWLRQTLKAAPTHFAAMTYLGLCAERLEMPKTAADLYQAAIRESKNQKKPYSWAFLSYGQLLRQAGNEREALAVLEEAEKICPSAEALSLLGQMVVKTDPGRAEMLLRRALSMNSGLPDAHYRLAMLLRGRGQTDEAQTELRNFQEAKNAEERNKAKIQAIRKEP